jgi:hypothetical protein
LPPPSASTVWRMRRRTQMERASRKYRPPRCCKRKRRL